jgi:Bacterial Ig-like domain (group 2)
MRLCGVTWYLLAASLGAPVYGGEPVRLDVEPHELTLEVGERATLKASALDAEGKPTSSVVVFYSRAMASVGVTPLSVVDAYRPGDFVVVAMVPKYDGLFDVNALNDYDESLLTVEIPVRVPKPRVASVSFDLLPSAFYAGTRVALRAKVVDAANVARSDVEVRFASRDPDVAAVDATGQLTANKAGRAILVARAEGVEGIAVVDVVSDPVVSLTLDASAEKARTGDVIHFRATARDAEGREVSQYPIQLATFSRPAPGIIAPGAEAFIDPDGAFVAERSGLHTVVAVAGPHSARKTVEIGPRNVQKDIEVVGHGAVRDRHTSDLWVWEAPNGRDYAVTGTWGADGHAYFWEVTDPKNIQLVDTVRVDARTVNDVKVSEDGRIAVISREGASNRKNGLVILDVSNPSEGVRILPGTTTS